MAKVLAAVERSSPVAFPYIVRRAVHDGVSAALRLESAK
jgi:hypothetical protein